MAVIEMDIWERTAENPRILKYVGQRTAQEVFGELKDHLENIGYLPDEYFLMDRHWENGAEIPKGADIVTLREKRGKREGKKAKKMRGSEKR
jgi:hypothetical protein